ncbi:MAG: M16 family metallopeptidase [Candidatus Aminicenantales bacterium]
MKLRNSGRKIGIAAAALVWTATLPAQTAFLTGISHYTLKNGLTVIFQEQADLPVVSVAIGYNAGSIHEAPGKTGVAYLLEKLMMFAGSANVSPLEHISDINRVGGTLNAEALEDQTLFYQTIPSNHLAMALWLESDRMRTLDLSKEKFEKARTDLLEELRNRRTSEPFLTSLQTFDQLLYSDFSFGHSLLGVENDIRNLTAADVKSFYDARYVPQNAVLCISGRFDRPRALELVARYFESIPGGKAPATAFETPTFVRMPFSRTEVDPVASAPAVFLGFRLGPPGSLQARIQTLLDFVLLKGRSARLNRRLLNREAKIAFQLSGGIESRYDRSVYKIFIIASPPQIQACSDAVFSELDKLKRAFLSEAELAKAKTLYREDVLNRTATSKDRAVYLIQAFLTQRAIGGTLEDALAETEKILKITRSEIVTIVNRYFVLENCIVLYVRMK